ncbi:SRPBCC domain-containing protein [Jiangella alba]|uniref:Uncharacterized conserved protein YndB, AHSA1/START domain n=1 Tax=Jiangella alba TaxID=561176 RepID=A0A1H5PQF1_9ACTN|nr:SRPBCC domain-containing protein [Jiangella alba]SEF16050.1 Uncharacterized conserved protein YndB, AHSA1/START domain [Jiangella alba]
MIDTVEHGSIERVIHVEAPPHVVYEVLSRPEHLRRWWPDDARFEPVVGARGELMWRNTATAGTETVALAVVDADPPRRICYRSSSPEFGGRPSLLVAFALVPERGGTRVHLTQTAFLTDGAPSPA